MLKRSVCTLLFLSLTAWVVAAELGIRPIVGVIMSEANKVDFVVKGSVGKRVGLQKGDLVLAVNGQKISNVTDLRTVMGSVKPGSKLKIDYRRNGTKFSKTAVFEAPSSPFKAYQIEEGVGLPGELEVGWSVERALQVLKEKPQSDLTDYRLYPGSRWSDATARKTVVQVDFLGVAVGVVDGKVDFVDFYYPMVARSTRGVATNGSRADIEAAYGPPESTTDDERTVWLHYPSKGISFTVADPLVRRIVVYAPKK